MTRLRSTTPPADIRVLIVDDTCLYREGLAGIVARQPGVMAVDTAADLTSALAALAAGPADIVLLNLATIDSPRLLAAIQAAAPDSRLVVLGASEAEDEIVACAEAGVAGYLLRSESLDHLLRLMHTVAADGALCSPRTTAILLRRVATLAAERRRAGAGPVLTVRENQILALLDQGMSNREIAERLGIEVRTVKNHVHHILEKLGVRRRGEAVAVARMRRSGLAGAE